MDFTQKLQERLTRYVKIDTHSDDSSTTQPTTPMQMDFAKLLKKELEDIGVKKVTLTDKAHLMAEIPANTDKKMPKIAFFAHLDTVKDFPPDNIKPQVHKNYQGGNIEIKKGMFLTPEKEPDLANCIGHDIVTASGDTILGADDKAGIAIIVTLLEYYISNPDVKHGVVKAAFTPDEEGTGGIDNFPVKEFGADFGYTIDGSTYGQINDSNFNAESFVINIKGYSVHPGSAKNIMVNPVRIAGDILSMWPVEHMAETTEKEEGFVLFTSMEGSLEGAVLKGIIREHDLGKLKKLREMLNKIVELLRVKYPAGKIDIKFHTDYFNMKEALKKTPEAMDRLKRALVEEGVVYHIAAIRGGSDGSHLTERGLPCPNIFAGYGQPHGPYEWASLQQMEKVLKIAMRIVSAD